MNSLILRSSAGGLLWVLLAFSVYVLIRGHNEPGGGFIGGLIAAAGVAVYALSRGTDAARRRLILEPKAILGLGLGLALVSGLPALAGGDYLTHLWTLPELLGVTIPLGTALIFDVGVYLTVIGALSVFLLPYLED